MIFKYFDARFEKDNTILVLWFHTKIRFRIRLHWQWMDFNSTYTSRNRSCLHSLMSRGKGSIGGIVGRDRKPKLIFGPCACIYLVAFFTFNSERKGERERAFWSFIHCLSGPVPSGLPPAFSQLFLCHCNQSRSGFFHSRHLSVSYFSTRYSERGNIDVCLKSRELSFSFRHTDQNFALQSKLETIEN